MSDIKNVLVVVPARGGSKRIPHKNILDIAGKPMIHWPLEELLKNFDADKILVSTDDHAIIRSVAKLGLAVPFVRPKELSDDYVGTTEVAEHALCWYESTVTSVDFVIMVYPTAVMVRAKDVYSALSMLVGDPSCDYVMSATSFPFPIQRAVCVSESGYARACQPEQYASRSQDLPEAFHDAGQFYVYRAESLRKAVKFNQAMVKLKVLPRHIVVDIDNAEDLRIAESLLMARNGLS